MNGEQSSLDSGIRRWAKNQSDASNHVQVYRCDGTVETLAIGESAPPDASDDNQQLRGRVPITPMGDTSVEPHARSAEHSEAPGIDNRIVELFGPEDDLAFDRQDNRGTILIHPNNGGPIG